MPLALQATFPDADVRVHLPDYWSVEDQVALMRNSSVLIAVEGGALDSLLFAPEGLTVVALGRDPGLPHPIGCIGGQPHRRTR